MSTQSSTCLRCGIQRMVKPERGVSEWCRDCCLVEADLAAMHGTPAGYKRHWRAGELACEACLRAHSAAIIARYRANGVKPRRQATCGTEGGYQRHKRLGEPACPACLRATSAASLARYYRRRAAA